MVTRFCTAPRMSSSAIRMSMARMPFDPFKEVVPVTSLVSNQIVLTVNPSSPANSLREFVELARSSKPPLFYASIGNGSNHHLAMETLKAARRHRPDPCALSRRPRGDRAAQRCGVDDVRRWLGGADDQIGQAARAGYDRQRAQPGEPWVVSPEELSARIKTDYEKYGKLIRSIGVKVE